MTVYQWQEISNDYKHALIVGNGASISVSRSFSYGSLLEEARGQGYLGAALNDLFTRFNTEDFELLLRHLWHAQIVNEALEVNVGAVTDAYSIVQTALIQAVQSVHCDHATTEPVLLNIGSFMAQFQTVFSLNYDLITYWALLRYNDTYSEHTFKDCFHNGYFRTDWPNFREPIRGERSVTLVFYPHGALHLVTDRSGDDLKLSLRSEGTFLDTIFSEWKEKKSPPLIVCDGSSEQKARTIRSSAYLSTVLNEVLPTTGPTVTIYGWGLGDQEDHILRQLGKGGYKKAAVSVHMPGNEQGQDFVRHAIRKLRSVGITDVKFYDAASAGCWANPRPE